MVVPQNVGVVVKPATAPLTTAGGDPLVLIFPPTLRVGVEQKASVDNNQELLAVKSVGVSLFSALASLTEDDLDAPDVGVNQLAVTTTPPAA